jgi:N utilization substance protein B
MQALCQLDVQGADLLPALRMFFRENSDEDLVIRLAEQWTEGAWSFRQQCDEEIARAAEKWTLSRLSMVDRSILRLGAYQILFCPDIPEKVSINEAIELAKKYGGVQSPRFVNGVLDAVFRGKKSDLPKPTDVRK